MMRLAARLALTLALASTDAAAVMPDLKIYSEFRRIDPFGEVVSSDRGGRVREVLSPAVARNAFASFRIVVTVPPDTPAWLYIQQNPENRFRPTVYREQYARAGKEWIPDGLQRVTTPCFLILPDSATGVRGQTTQSYWLDLWVPPNAPVERVRVQALAKIGERWLVYPLEIRVMAARLATPAAGSIKSPARAQPLLEPAAAAYSYALCGGPPAAASLSVRRLLQRNAARDLTLPALVDYVRSRSIECGSRSGEQDREWPLDSRRRANTAGN
jgi:hypothetical protein